MARMFYLESAAASDNYLSLIFKKLEKQIVGTSYLGLCRHIYTLNFILNNDK